MTLMCVHFEKTQLQFQQLLQILRFAIDVSINLFIKDKMYKLIDETHYERCQSKICCKNCSFCTF